MDTLTTLQLTPVEAGLFKEFMRCYDNFKVLYENGIFNVRNGKAIVNFDAAGTVTQVNLDLTMYKKGFPNVIAIVNL